MTRIPPRRLVGASTAVAAAALLVLAAPLSASAHVHVVPESAPAGDYATLSFKVPTESATASTTKVEVDFPTDHPFTSVSYQPIVGWTTVVTTSTLPEPVKTDDGTITKGVTKVTWTAAAGQGIAPGAFQLFTVSAGAVPDTGSVELPATQTYSDGSVVRWNEATPASGEEPEHPAPTLYIDDAPPADADQGIVAATSSAAPAAPAAAASGSSGSGSSAAGLGLGIAGLGLGVIALIVALLAYVRSARGPRAAITSAAASDRPAGDL